MILLSLLISGLLLAGAACTSNLARPTDTSLSVGRFDVAALFLRRFEFIRKKPSVAFFIWSFVSFLLGVVLPWIVGTRRYFGEKDGIVITLEYTFVVSGLLAAYLWLTKTADAVFGSDPRSLPETVGIQWTSAERKIEDGQTPESRLRWAFPWRVMLIVASLLIQYAAISSVLTNGKEYFPWLEEDAGGHRTLSLIGSAYYALRGINTCLALGLMVAMLAIWWRFEKDVDFVSPEKLITDDLVVEKRFIDLQKAIIAAILCASWAILFHGLALTIILRETPSLEKRMEVFVGSTWLVWVFLGIAGAAVGTRLIFLFHAKVEEGLNKKIKDLVKLVQGSDVEAGGGDASRFMDSADLVAKRRQLKRETRTWPLSIGPSLLIQGVNVTVTVLALVV